MEATFTTPLFVNKNGRRVRVMPKDVVCINAERAYCKMYVSGWKQPVEFSYSMGCIRDQMPKGLLLPVGRSWCVNVDHIKAIDANVVVMDNDVIVDAAKSAIDELESHLFIIG